VSSSAVYVRLGEQLNLTDHVAVLNAIMNRIVANLKNWATDEEIVDKTLGLFYDLALGYSSGKLLQKLEVVQMMLRCHTAEHFPFLTQSKRARHRAKFYHTLTLLLLMNDHVQQDIEHFLTPFAPVFVGLRTAVDTSNAAPEVRHAFLGLMPDLRGMVCGATLKSNYLCFFEWIYPDYLPGLLAATAVWWNDSDVMVALLKFVCELAHNKCQRITFDSSSPQGILLFREISKVLVGYGTRILSMPLTADPYQDRYKGISIALETLARALTGNYVNFGVFSLYGDKALDDALRVTLQLALSLPIQEVLAYKKVMRAYFEYFNTLCTQYAAHIVELDSGTWAQIMGALHEGVRSFHLDSTISSECASAIDSLISIRFRQHRRDLVLHPHFDEHIRANPELLPTVLTTLFELVMFEMCPNQWSLSRPLLGLILLNEAAFPAVKRRLVQHLAEDKQVRIFAAFDKLMSEVQRNIEPKNRDRFTQMLTLFRQDVRGLLT